MDLGSSLSSETETLWGELFVGFSLRYHFFFVSFVERRLLRGLRSSESGHGSDFGLRNLTI